MPPSLVSIAGQQEEPPAPTNGAATLRAQEALQQIALLVMWLRHVVFCLERSGRSGRNIVLRKPRRGVRKKQDYRKVMLGGGRAAHIGSGDEKGQQQLLCLVKGDETPQADTGGSQKPEAPRSLERAQESETCEAK